MQTQAGYLLLNSRWCGIHPSSFVLGTMGGPVRADSITYGNLECDLK